MDTRHEVWTFPDGRQYYSEVAFETWTDIEQGVQFSIYARGFSDISPADASAKAVAEARRRIEAMKPGAACVHGETEPHTFWCGDPRAHPPCDANAEPRAAGHYCGGKPKQ